MTRLAEALMWNEQHLFDLNFEIILCVSNEKDGKFLLNEIMLIGNFVQANGKLKGVTTNILKKFWYVNCNTFKY